MRALRSRTVRHAAVALAATALTLGLTACNGATDTDAGGSTGSTASAGSGSDSAGSGSDSGGSGGAKGQTTGGSSTGGSSSGGKQEEGDVMNGGGSADRGSGTAVCGTGDLEFEVKPVSRPVNHVLLVVTNTSDRPCHVIDAPYVRWGEAQSSSQIVESSAPEAEPELAPGGSAYAGVMTSSAGEDTGEGVEETEVTITLRDLKGGTVPGTLSASTNSVYISNETVTHWRSSADEALTY